MHALVVVSHPQSDSLSHAVARQAARGITESGHSFELADLAAEGFDPRFTMGDIAVHRRERPQLDDVRREQARVERADALVLVYPVYWWSMPALMKGWIDRVFANGWAYDESDGLPLVKRMRHLPVHLLALAGASTRTYARHGYFGAMRTQIEHGIFDYCGAPVVRSELLMMPDLPDSQAYLDRAREIGAAVFGSARAAAA